MSFSTDYLQHSEHTFTLNIIEFAFSFQMMNGFIMPQKVTHNLIAAVSTERNRTGFSVKQQNDNVGKGSYIIYRSSMSKLMYISYGGTTTFVIPFVAQAIILLRDKLGEPDPTFTDINDPVVFSLCGSVFGVALVVALRALIKPTIQRIYYNDQAEIFTAIWRDWKFQKHKIIFTVNDVTPREPSRYVGDALGNFYLKGHAAYLLSKDFRTIAHCNLLTGEAQKQK